MSKNVHANSYNYPSYEDAYVNFWSSPLLVDSETLEFPFCGKDGFAEIDIQSIKNIISSETDIYTSTESVVYVSTENGSILKVDNLSSIPPDEVELCNVGFALTDIAVDKNEVVYVTSKNDLYTIDISTCTLTKIPQIHPDYFAVALSFDTAGNLYFGGSGRSMIYRQDQNKLSDAYVWHDFGVGSSAGDFVMLNGKMYIAWRISLGNVHLYEVEVDSDFNYVSHVDLGALDGKTYGLASENGQLYSISAYSMYKISSLVPITEDKVYWNSSAYGEWYGAAGLHEAQKLNIQLYETPQDLSNQTNELPDTWKNTVKGGQTLHVRIEEEESGTVVTKTIDVIIYEKPNAGDDAVIDVCNLTDSYDLFSELGIDAENGGTWENPNGVAFGAGDMATFNGSSNDFGVYTYTVITAHCDDTAVIEFRNANDFDTGLPPTAAISLCPQSAPINLFDALLGTPDAGGFWRDPNGVTFGSDDLGRLDPSQTGMLSGDYEYVLYSGICGVETSTEVNIEIKSPPVTILEMETTICKQAGSKNLFDEISGSVKPGGVWYAPNTTVFGVDHLGTFDPLLDAVGVYIYSEPDSCEEPIAKLTVLISSKANSGITNTVELCTTDLAVNLFDQLGGNPDLGGSWKDPNGVVFGVGHEANLDPSVTGVLSGAYTYTVSTVDCPDPALTVIDVTIDKAPNVGSDLDIKVCKSQAEFDLFGELSGTPDSNGTWKDPNGLDYGTANTAMFNPQTSEYGSYTYTVTTPNCGSVSAIVKIEAATSANSGTTNTVELCTTDLAVNLFDQLGGNPDLGGSWKDPNGVDFGVDHEAVLDPSVIGVLSGNYTYTVLKVECPDPASTVINVTINETPEIKFVNKVFSADYTTYEVLFTTNSTWGITVSPTGIGIIDSVNSKITGIPEGIDVEIMVENSLNMNCSASISVESPTFVCPNVENPTNPTNKTICLGDNSPELSVDVNTSLGEFANWYDDSGQLVRANSLIYTPENSLLEGVYKFFVEAVDASGRCASERVEVLLKVKDIPVIELSSQGTLCFERDGSLVSGSEVIIVSGLLSSEYTFEWQFEGVTDPAEISSLIKINQPGEYILKYTHIGANCSKASKISIDSTLAPETLELKLSSGSFAEENDIIAIVKGGGNYEYSLDGGEYQTSNVFSNVSLGWHEVTLLSVCGSPITAKKYVMGFPKFFTPNGDNINETWNLKFDQTESIEVNIFVYDRFGKLIQQVFPNKTGWDGTFAGKNMPSDDYWFIATIKGTSEVYTSHFTLIR